MANVRYTYYTQSAPETRSADDELTRKRRLNVLHRELDKAVREEDFERAAEIRDRINELEKGAVL